jgi:glutamate dehydrogenase
VKTHIFQELSASDPAEIRDFDERVLSYFPDAIRKKYSAYIPDHMLHKSIGMTVLITEVVGDAGVLFFPMLKEWTGASAIQISRAWLLAMDMVNGNAIRAEIDRCEASFDAKYRAWIEVQNAIAGVAAFALSAGESGLVGDPVETIREVLRHLPRVRGAAHQEQLAKMGQGHLERGIPEATAAKIATLTKLTIAREIALLHDPKDRVNHTVIRYISVGEATGILPALRKMRVEQTSGPWDQVALAILRNRFFALMRSLYVAIPLGAEVRLGVNRIKRRLIRKGPLGQLTNEVERLLSSRPDTAMLLVAEERIRGALAGGLGDVDISKAAKSPGKANGKAKSAKKSRPTPATRAPAK